MDTNLVYLALGLGAASFCLSLYLYSSLKERERKLYEKMSELQQSQEETLKRLEKSLIALIDSIQQSPDAESPIKQKMIHSLKTVVKEIRKHKSTAASIVAVVGSALGHPIASNLASSAIQALPEDKANEKE